MPFTTLPFNYAHFRNKLDSIWAVVGKSMPLAKGNAVLRRAGVGLTLLKTEKEKVELLHVKQKH